MTDDSTSSVLQDQRGRLRPGFAAIASVFIALAILSAAATILNIVS